MKRTLLLFAILLAYTNSLRAVTHMLSDSSTVSVLTCNAGNEIYSYFGHSAIRIYDPKQNIDVVFNYGMFSFESKNFIYRFIKGETDYELGEQYYNQFLREYITDQRGVIETVLNLSTEQKQQILDALLVNYMPNNRVYRYNFFYDNCSSRIKVLLEETLKNQISFKTHAAAGKTYMNMLEPFLKNHGWTRIGIRIILGNPIYNQVDLPYMDFLPLYLHEDLLQAEVTLNGTSAPLTLKENTIIKNFPAEEPSAWSNPLVLLCVLLGIQLWIFYGEYKRKKACTIYTQVLFILTGLVGIFLSWFMCVSVHPAVFPNFDILWLSPLNFLFGLALCWKAVRNKQRTYHLFCTALSVIFYIICFRGCEWALLIMSALVYMRSWGYLLIPPWSNREQ